MVKSIKDYYEQLYEMYPDIPKRDIQRMVNYGWKQMHLINCYGGDVQLWLNEFWTYFGKLMMNPIRWFMYYKNKLAIKLLILYKRKRTKWDGYYYFAISKSLYEQLNIKKKGRPKKHFTFKNVKLFKCKEECYLREWNKYYVYKVPYIKDFFYSKFLREFKTDKAELIGVRDKCLNFLNIINRDYGLGNSN